MYIVVPYLENFSVEDEGEGTHTWDCILPFSKSMKTSFLNLRGVP